MYKNVKQGWYKLKNPERFIPPRDRHMQSFNESTGCIQHKSGMELKAFRLVDRSPGVFLFSVEPFPIRYVKPTDGREHRYYVDLYIEFVDGRRFIVEVKPLSQITPPKEPRNLTRKSMARHKKAMETYAINFAKWRAAREFARANGLVFDFLTEKDLCRFS